MIAIIFVSGCGQSPEAADTAKPSAPNSSTVANKKDPKQAPAKKPAPNTSLEERKSFQSLESILGNDPIPTDQTTSLSAVSGSLVGFWKCKQPTKGLLSESIEMKADGTFVLTAVTEFEQRRELIGTWKQISDKKIDFFFPGSEDVLAEKATGEILEAHSFKFNLPGLDIIHFARSTAEGKDLYKAPAVPLADQQKLIGVWQDKKPTPDMTSDTLTFNADGIIVNDVVYKNGLVYNLRGTWKMVSKAKIMFTLGQPANPDRTFESRAKLLDDGTLEVEGTVNPSIYVRKSDAAADSSKSNLAAPSGDAKLAFADPILERLHRLKFTKTWKKEGKPTPSTLSLTDDGRANFKPLPGAQEPMIEGVWNFVAENSIEIRHRPKAGASAEVYATGELIGDKTLKITIDGKQINYTPLGAR